MRPETILKRTAAVVLVATAGIGVLHAPFARSFLMRIGGCPMGGTAMTSRTDQQAREIALAHERGTGTAPARPALGFALDVTTLSDVRAWEKRAGADCSEPHEGLVECTNVPSMALGETAGENVKDLALQFRPDGRLVNMTTWRDHLSPASASNTAQSIVSSLKSTLGPANTTASGAFDAAHLGASPGKSISSVAYRYRDYIAEVTAMNAPWSGPSIREHYMSALN
jgi:hypothetical protein